MNHIIDRYYRYQPGEFLPIYEDGVLVNKNEFHSYKLKWILEHKKAALYDLTHISG